MEWFRGGLVFKVHSFWYHSALGSRGIKKKNTWARRKVPMEVRLNMVANDGVVTPCFEACFSKGQILSKKSFSSKTWSQRSFLEIIIFTSNSKAFVQ